MRAHELKCWPVYFEVVVSGTKTFEIRENDRDFMVGDILDLREFVPCEKCNGSGRYVNDPWDSEVCICGSPHGKYTGRNQMVQVTYITDYAQCDGHVVMSIIKK